MAKAMLPRERCDFSAIVDRPPLKLPGGARIVFWTTVNLEVWDIGKPMARQVLPPPTGQTRIPDVPNWSWHEYGMRVLASGASSISSSASRSARRSRSTPASAGLRARRGRGARAGGWEFMGHSYEQGPIHAEPDVAGMVARSLDILERFCGKRPLGWLGPGLTEMLDTPEILAAAGIEYIGDWVYDDEPTTIRTAAGPLVTLPYSVELNDIPMMIVQHHEGDYLLPAAPSTSSTASTPRARNAPKSWRSPSTPISAGNPTGSNTSKRFTTTSAASTASCTGPARKSWTGIS